MKIFVHTYTLDVVAVLLLLHHHFDVEIKFKSGCISDLKIKLTCFPSNIRPPSNSARTTTNHYIELNDEHGKMMARKTSENMKRDKSI